MPAVNMFLVYVSDAPAAARFYAELLDLEPDFESPRFVSFPLGGGVRLALWSGAEGAPAPSRTGELCVTTDGGPGQIDRWFHEWQAKGVRTVEEPHDDVFGRTFVVADPDGNLIRVAPVD